MAFYRRRPRPDAEKCADPAKARASALETLAGQEVSANMLYERLCRRYTEQAAAAAVAEMVQLDYVNDARYAEARAHSLLAARKSRRAAAQSLRQKGLAPAEVAGALEAVYAPEDGGDDPDCTHGAILFGNMRRCSASDARKEDYTLSVGGGTVILRGAAGVGLCTRPGLDCEQGKWAINTGPRRMIAENLHHAGLDAGCWLLEIGVENGEELAKHTLNPLLGVVGGISILGTTGLVRPYSHEAYIETVRICVKSHHIAHGTTMVFCTGGRTKSGAERRLPSLPETAFTCIGDFIAESLAAACEYGMREIVVACMAGKLCKYAAGFENTHAHKVSQDMDLLRAEVRKHLPGEEALHDALAHSVSVREALLSIPEADRPGILRRLARTALGQFARRCGENIALRLLVFDFEGQFLFEEKRGEQKEPEKNGKNFSGQSDPSHASASSPEAPTARSGEHAELSEYNGTIGLTYFLDGKKD